MKNEEKYFSAREYIEERSVPEPNSGYGQARWGDRNVDAHRLAYEAFNGPIPQGKYVLHKCDVKSCVNPDHLFTGTQEENLWDMSTKNRGVRRGANRLRWAYERNGRYIALVSYHNKSFCLGTFDTAEDAHSAAVVGLKALRA